MQISNFKPFHFPSFYMALLISAGITVWFSQKSINAYWQQTYHQAGILEPLNQYPWWTTGATAQDSVNEAYQAALDWFNGENEKWLASSGVAPNNVINDADLTAASSPNSNIQAASEAAQPTTIESTASSIVTLKPGEKVFFAGDSLMQGVAPFSQKWLSNEFQAESVNLSKQSTGLSYPSFFDWPGTIEKTLTEQPSIKLLVVFLGPNDPWDFVNPQNKAQVLRFKSPEWESEYRSRVARIVQAAQQHHVQIIWLGVPYMKAEKLNSQMRYLDNVLHEELKDKVIWLPTAELLSAGRGHYVDSINVDGKEAKVRSKDGIHFSPTGQKLLANLIDQHIRYQP